MSPVTLPPIVPRRPSKEELFEESMMRALGQMSVQVPSQIIGGTVGGLLEEEFIAGPRREEQRAREDELRDELRGHERGVLVEERGFRNALAEWTRKRELETQIAREKRDAALAREVATQLYDRGVITANDRAAVQRRVARQLTKDRHQESVFGYGETERQNRAAEGRAEERTIAAEGRAEERGEKKRSRALVAKYADGAIAVVAGKEKKIAAYPALLSGAASKTEGARLKLALDFRKQAEAERDNARTLAVNVLGQALELRDKKQITMEQFVRARDLYDSTMDSLAESAGFSDFILGGGGGVADREKNIAEYNRLQHQQASNMLRYLAHAAKLEGANLGSYLTELDKKAATDRAVSSDEAADYKRAQPLDDQYAPRPEVPGQEGEFTPGQLGVIAGEPPTGSQDDTVWRDEDGQRVALEMPVDQEAADRAKERVGEIEHDVDIRLAGENILLKAWGELVSSQEKEGEAGSQRKFKRLEGQLKAILDERKDSFGLLGKLTGGEEKGEAAAILATIASVDPELLAQILKSGDETPDAREKINQRLVDIGSQRSKADWDKSAKNDKTALLYRLGIPRRKGEVDYSKLSEKAKASLKRNLKEIDAKYERLAATDADQFSEVAASLLSTLVGLSKDQRHLKVVEEMLKTDRVTAVSSVLLAPKPFTARAQSILIAELSELKPEYLDYTLPQLRPKFKALLKRLIARTYEAQAERFGRLRKGTGDLKGEDFVVALQRQKKEFRAVARALINGKEGNRLFPREISR